MASSSLLITLPVFLFPFEDENMRGPNERCEGAEKPPMAKRHHKAEKKDTWISTQAYEQDVTAFYLSVPLCMEVPVRAYAHVCISTCPCLFLSHQVAPC